MAAVVTSGGNPSLYSPERTADEGKSPQEKLTVPGAQNSPENSSHENANHWQVLRSQQQQDLDTLIAEAQLANRAKNQGFLYEISFKIHYKTVFGEKIVVTGNTEWLGNWDPLRGFELEWTPGNLWTNTFLLAEGSLQELEYKYVCVRSNNACRWEQRRNRSLSPDQGSQQGNKLVFLQTEHWDK